MSTISNILLEPLLSGLGSGSATWPTLGAVLAWFLAPALLGMLLHRLREPAGSVRRQGVRVLLLSRAMRGKNFSAWRTGGAASRPPLEGASGPFHLDWLIEDRRSMGRK